MSLLQNRGDIISVSVTLKGSDFPEAVKFLRQNGFEDPANALTEEVFYANTTHNLMQMANAAGIYQSIWEGSGLAKDLIAPLEAGIKWLKENKEEAESYNSSNGWGTYEHFLPWVERYLEACKKYPEATVSVST